MANSNKPSPTFLDHAEHGLWERQGRCLHCPCGARLYQGEPPGSIDKQREIARTFDELTDAVQRYHAARVAARGEATSDE